LVNIIISYYYDVESESCTDNWSSHSSSAGNPDISYVVISKSSTATAVCKEVLGCYRKVVV
jgi:Fanconi anemia group D2 protein